MREACGGQLAVGGMLSYVKNGRCNVVSFSVPHLPMFVLFTDVRNVITGCATRHQISRDGFVAHPGWQC